MKRLFATMITLAVITTCFSGCGADKATDNAVSTNRTEAAVDRETTGQVESVTEEKEKAPVGKLEDCPKLTIELKDGKTFTYNGESFEDVYQQLTDLGLVTDDAKAWYEEQGVFNSGYLEASNGTVFCIDYLSNKKEFIVRTGSGVRDEIAWNIVIGDIDNTMTIADLVDMGATEIKEKNPHSEVYNVTDYLLTSTNFETKGVSIEASGDGSPQPEDLIVEGIYITYTGVEK